jgi:hypothetical protein
MGRYSTGTMEAAMIENDETTLEEKGDLRRGKLEWVAQTFRGRGEMVVTIEDQAWLWALAGILWDEEPIW